MSADSASTVTVQLAPSLLQLDAVVVSGTAGQARVREIGNSIAQVNLSQVKDPPANMDQLLQARAPGLSVMQTSGMAGEGAQIRLRGAVSVSQSNQPIVYIDGVRMDANASRGPPAAASRTCFACDAFCYVFWSSCWFHRAIGAAGFCRNTG